MMGFAWTTLVATALVAGLTAGGMAVRTVSRIWLRHWAEQRLRGSAAALSYLVRPQHLLASVGAGSAIALVVAGETLGVEQRGPTLAAALVALAAVVVTFGQIVPRAIARRWPAALAPLVLPIVHAAAIVVAPVNAFGCWLAKPWVPTRAAEPAESDRDAVQDLLREGELEGVGERDEIAIVSGVVDFSEKRVADVMTSRTDIFALEAGTDARALAEQIARAGYSRVPIYRGSLDHVVGMVHAFDVLKAGGEEFPRVRPVRFAAPDDPCNELLFRMLRERLHLAIVRDTAGKTAGLVTLEDLLEELVGDIRDEHDEPESPRGATPP